MTREKTGRADKCKGKDVQRKSTQGQWKTKGKAGWGWGWTQKVEPGYCLPDERELAPRLELWGQMGRYSLYPQKRKYWRSVQSSWKFGRWRHHYRDCQAQTVPCPAHGAGGQLGRHSKRGPPWALCPTGVPRTRPVLCSHPVPVSWAFSPALPRRPLPLFCRRSAHPLF